MLNHLLLLLLLLAAVNVLSLPGLSPQRNIIKVRASGFLPFESDLLLPLGVLRQLQAQDRSSRLLSNAPPITHQQLQYKRPKGSKTKKKQQVRLERAQLFGKDAVAGTQMYNLIDDDGELLLNLRVHSDGSEQPFQQITNNFIQHNHIDETPWVPSLWRPTTLSPLAYSYPISITSSSPRPLPVHQYLSNSIEQQPLKRRMLRRTTATDDFNES